MVISYNYTKTRQRATDLKVVILGGNGYLGEKLGKELFRNGMSVYSVVRKKIPQDWTKEVWDYDELLLKLGTHKIDYMVNCITKYERGNVTDIDVLEANYLKPFWCFMQGIQTGINKYMTMDTGLSIDCNMYSRSKKQLADSMEWKLNEQFGQSGYVFWNIQLENFYGADEPSERFLLNTICKLRQNEKVMLTEGKQRRDFIYIDDVVNNLAKILSIPTQGRVNLPLGTGEGISIREAITYLKEVTNSDSELVFGAIPSRKVEPDSIADTFLMKKFGLSIRYDWKNGFKHLVDELRT